MNIAILISGRGTNLEAILKAEQEKKLGEATVVLIISNNPDALGLSLAQKFQKKTAIVDRKNFQNTSETEEEMLRLLEESKIDLIVLAGFMQILSPNFITIYENKIINIHPSLLPSFPGLHAQKQALDKGVKLSGCTVHFVNEKVDDGPIILQKQVKVMEEDTEEDLSQRILKEEHILLPKAISLFSMGKIAINGNKVRVVE